MQKHGNAFEPGRLLSLPSTAIQFVGMSTTDGKSHFWFLVRNDIITHPGLFFCKMILFYIAMLLVVAAFKFQLFQLHMNLEPVWTIQLFSFSNLLLVA